MKVLVFIEQREGKIKQHAKEALSCASLLASSDVYGVCLGKVDADSLAQIKRYGAQTIYSISDEGLLGYNCLNYAQALCEAIKNLSPDLVLGIASPLGKDLFARLSARLEAGLLTDLVEVSVSNSQIKGAKPMYAGKTLAQVGFSSDSGLRLVTIRPNVFEAHEKSGESSHEELKVALPGSEDLKLLEIIKGSHQETDLAEASRIISGGRALASEANFKILRDCALTIGASVGASRAAVDSGYASHDMQVGQTGKTVNPSLYIACGISGSIQHMAGMRTSKVIVSVNTDEEAPILAISDYAIVGDLFQVVPLLTEEFKKLHS